MDDVKDGVEHHGRKGRAAKEDAYYSSQDTVSKAERDESIHLQVRDYQSGNHYRIIDNIDYLPNYLTSHFCPFLSFV